jgi:prolyl oligopeptidase
MHRLGSAHRAMLRILTASVALCSLSIVTPTAATVLAQTGTQDGSKTHLPTEKAVIETTESDKMIHGRDNITLPAPPLTRTAVVVDSYASVDSPTPVEVADPYRWLEDAHSPATRAFIAAQNAYTAKYFAQVKMLPATRTQIADLLKVDTMGVPTRRGDRYFFSKRLAAENQASLYVRTGLHGADTKLIDGNTLSKDQNTSVGMLDLSHTGDLMAYSLRVGGADEFEVHFLNTRTRASMPDVLPSARYYGIELAPDGKGVFYARFFPHQGTRVFYHRFGAAATHAEAASASITSEAAQIQDPQIFGGSYNGQTLGEIDAVGINVTDDGHYLVYSINYGVPARRVDLLTQDLTAGTNPDGTPKAAITPLIFGVDSRFDYDYDNSTFYVRTDFHSPNGRILRAVPGEPVTAWPTIIPEGKDVIEESSIVDGSLYILRLHDVRSEVTIYSLDGHATGTIDLPGIGAGSTLRGRASERDGFYTFQSIIAPPTIYHYDTKTGKSEVFNQTKTPFQTGDYTLEQVFFKSKDGTRIPMFIAGKKGLKRDGTERLLMTGYGGFAVSMTPTWNPEYAWWMQQGGWFALPDLRGGNEYGEDWHKAAMFANKQNVFDDWYAAAEYLIHNKYTSPEHFAIRGRSNGGLLMGASMTQRPELFGAIWCGYPLLDMLRYQRFLMGRTWTTEYGSAENPKDFPYIFKYSPYQHVVEGTKYPAIFFFTGDGDTRVDPMNARKMTPLMQAASRSDRPILLHYSTEGGHSAGVSQTQLIEDYADEMSFLWTETGTK